MFKWYKSGIFEKVIPQIRSSGIDLRLSGIVGIYTDTEVARLKAPAKRRSAGRFQRMRTFNAVFLKVAKVIFS